MVKGLEGKMHEERLRSLGLLSPQQSRPRGGLMAACSSLTRGAEGQALSSALWDSDRTRGDGMELGQGRVRLGVRERVCTQRWSGTGTGCPWTWAPHQACQRSRSVWTPLSSVGPDFWVVLRGARSGTQ